MFIVKRNINLEKSKRAAVFLVTGFLLSFRGPGYTVTRKYCNLLDRKHTAVVY